MDYDSGLVKKISERFAKFCASKSIDLGKTNIGIIDYQNAAKSAKPYVDLGLDFGILEIQGDRFFRNSSIYFFDTQNEYRLELPDLILFWNLIMKRDAFGIFLIISTLSLEVLLYKQFKHDVESRILKLISLLPKGHLLLNSLNIISSKFLNKFNLDSFLLPRINWLLDLRIVDLKYQPTTKKQISELIIIPSVGCLEISNEVVRKLNSSTDFDFNAWIAKFDLRMLQHGN